MKSMWEKIKQLETLLEEYRSGLRVRMEKIKKTETEIKTLSMNLNESRSPSRDKEFIRCSLPVSDHELSLHESVLSVPQNDEDETQLVEGEEDTVGKLFLDPYGNFSASFLSVFLQFIAGNKFSERSISNSSILSVCCWYW